MRMNSLSNLQWRKYVDMLLLLLLSLKINGHHGSVQRIPFGCLKRPRSTSAHRMRYNDTASWSKARTVFTRPWTVNTKREHMRVPCQISFLFIHYILHTNEFIVNYCILHYSEISSKWALKQLQDFLWQGTWVTLHQWHRTADLIPDAERLQVSLAWLHGDPVPGTALECVNASALRILRSSWFIDVHRAFKSAFAFLRSKHSLNPTWNCWVGAESGSEVLAKW